MLVYDLEQGTEEWLKLRLGIPTTSSFGKIITPTGAYSSQAEGYMNKLIGELLTGESEPFFKSDAMKRGNELEPVAVEYYAAHTKTKPKEVGFITSDCGRIGCSPDRLVGNDGLLEVKCPMPTKHSENMFRGVMDSDGQVIEDGELQMDPQYIPQVQGQLLMTGRKWCDWMSYHPDLPPVIIRVYPDEEYQDSLKKNLNHFIEVMWRKIRILESRNIQFKGGIPGDKK